MKLPTGIVSFQLILSSTHRIQSQGEEMFKSQLEEGQIILVPCFYTITNWSSSIKVKANLNRLLFCGKDVKQVEWVTLEKMMQEKSRRSKTKYHFIYI